MRMKEGYVLPDLGGIEGGLPLPAEKEIRRKEAPTELKWQREGFYEPDAQNGAAK